MLEVVVKSLTHEAEGVIAIELISANGDPLPPFSPGSHIDVHLPGGLCRQYSLTNNSAESDRYCLGIGLAPDSRGGSKHIHQKIGVGDRLRVGSPRQLFGMDDAATEHVFIAGGIGITPILSMIQWCESMRRPWKLLYCVRSRARAAYLWQLSEYRSRVLLHIDEDSDKRPNIHDFITSASLGSHVYCCGPSPLMQLVETCAKDAGLHNDQMHFERFSVPVAAEDKISTDRAFDVVLSRQGIRLNVLVGRSILETLEDHGIDMPHSCREGLCRSCEVHLLEGDVDHRDYVLNDQERLSNGSILICVSRAKGHELVLDV